MTDKTNALLPCPFCGENANFGTRPNEKTRWSVHCDGCTAYRTGGTEVEAIAAWNARSESYAQFINGMEAAAQICGSLAETTYDDADAFEAATGCEAAIMAVVKEKRRECVDNVEWSDPLTDEEHAMIDAAWEKHKAAGPQPPAPLEGCMSGWEADPAPDDYLSSLPQELRDAVTTENFKPIAAGSTGPDPEKMDRFLSGKLSPFKPPAPQDDLVKAVRLGIALNWQDTDAAARATIPIAQAPSIAERDALRAKLAAAEACLDDAITTIAAVRATATSNEWADSAKHFYDLCGETLRRTALAMEKNDG